jgi:hypothetical protein
MTIFAQFAIAVAGASMVIWRHRLMRIVGPFRLLNLIRSPHPWTGT